MLKRIMLTTLICSTALATPVVFGESKIVWACAASGTTEEDLYLVEWGRNSYVKLYGVRVWGDFETSDGGEKRWDFGEGRSPIADYSVLLKPDGELDYYDFRDVAYGQAVEPAYKYQCRLAQS